jgi:hypothetical protein
MKPDIVATIRFLTNAEGGRESKIPAESEFYSYPFKHNGLFNDCRLILGGFGEIAPGDTLKDVPILFLSPGEVVKRLSVGDPFTLWEAGTKAEGFITEIIKRNV